MSTLALLGVGYAIILPPVAILVALVLRDRRRTDSRRLDP